MTDEAIYDVTDAIKHLLGSGLGSGYKVSICPPWDELVTDDGINLFLYRIEENSQLKNMDWSGKRSDSMEISPLSLELFYLVTPYSSQEAPNSVAEKPETHKILGKAMRILNENPILNDIHNPYFDSDNDDHFPGNLRNSFEKVKVTLDPMDMEEMSRIWSMGDKPYRLSVSYHVSLVQIDRAAPERPIAPPVQETALKVETLASPLITILAPGCGPVGTEVHISGKNLEIQGFTTAVRFGDAYIRDFADINAHEIVLAVPDDLKLGPEQKVTVHVGDRESNSRIFTVSPWIASLKPQRGAVDMTDAHAVPIDIYGYDLQGDVQIDIGGVSVDAADITVVNENLIKTYVPNSLGNGHHDIKLKVDGNLTNRRTFEVIPLIIRLNPSRGVAGDPVEVMGQRLDGGEIRISIGPAVIIAKANEQLRFNVPKTLNPGQYEVRVAVDGHESNVKTFEVAGDG